MQLDGSHLLPLRDSWEAEVLATGSLLPSPQLDSCFHNLQLLLLLYPLQLHVVLLEPRFEGLCLLTALSTGSGQLNYRFVAWLSSSITCSVVGMGGLANILTFSFASCIVKGEWASGVLLRANRMLLRASLTLSRFWGFFLHWLMWFL